MHAVRMLEDREGSPNHTHVHRYKAGEVYSRESVPPVSDDLMAGFVASGHALEVDAQGNPIGTPADARARKAAWAAHVRELMGPTDAPALAAEDDAPEHAPEAASDAVAAETANGSPAASEAAGEPVDVSQDDANDGASESDESGPARRARK